MNADNIFSIAISAGLYAFSAWVFYVYVKFVFEKLAPKLTSGSLDFKFIVSFLVGSLLFLGLLTMGPPQIAKALKSGWEQFIPVMTEAMQMVIDDVDSIMSGNTPVYLPTNETNTSSETTSQTFNPPPATHNSGGAAALDPSVWQRPDPTGGIDTSADQAGGGAPENWTPDMPVPTPSP